MTGIVWVTRKPAAVVLLCAVLVAAPVMLLQESRSWVFPDAGDSAHAYSDRQVMQTSAVNFTIIVLPDTQHYSASYPVIFDNQTRWIVGEAENMNTVFVTHEGDIVDSDTLVQ